MEEVWKVCENTIQFLIDSSWERDNLWILLHEFRSIFYENKKWFMGIIKALKLHRHCADDILSMAASYTRSPDTRKSHCIANFDTASGIWKLHGGVLHKITQVKAKNEPWLAVQLP